MDKQKKNDINNCLQGIKRRDEESLIRLYNLISPSIRFISLKFLQDEEDAKDLEQDFWARIYEIADNYFYVKNAFSFLCKVMTRMAINRYRKIHGDKQRVTEFVDYSKIHSFDENAMLDNLDARLSVQMAMNTLDETEKIITQLTVFEDKTIWQIAKELNMSKSQVGRKKLEAQEKLKQKLSEKSWEKSEC